MRLSRLVRNLSLLLPAAAALLYGGLRLYARPNHTTLSNAIIGKQPDGTYLVPTGQTLTPAGDNISFDGRPVDMALSPDGATLAVMLDRVVRLFDTANGKFLSQTLPGEHSFGGILWSKDGHTLYTTGRTRLPEGASESARTGVVFVTDFDAAGHTTGHKPIRFALDSHIKPDDAATDSCPCGLALSPDGKTLYVSLFNNSTLAAVDLSSYDPDTGAAKVVEAPVGSSPEKVVVNTAGDKIYVADRGGKAPEAGDTMDTQDPVVVDPNTYKVATGTISVIDAARMSQDPQHAVSKTIPVGLQPADMALSPDGKRLFVANANGDSISVIDTGSDAVVETIQTSPAPGQLAESSPNGLALSPDGTTLYITLGGDNAVEALTLDRDAGGSAAQVEIAGLIPTAWFPLSVKISSDGHKLYVANSKGIGSLGAQVTRQLPVGAAMPQAGPGGALAPRSFTGHSVYSVQGSVGVIPVPDVQALQRDTQQVARDNHFDLMNQALHEQPDPFWSRFKHVILVIKENRTYDQVFGDISVPPGHMGGDPHLVMFGEQITPNHHALAREFGLFDNLYCSGEISADGHHWLNEAFADDYDERAMDDYPRSYPCCGTDPLVYAGNRFVWQEAMEAGRTFRDYGEFGPLPSMARHASQDYNSAYTVSANLNEDVAHSEHILADLAQSDPAKSLAQLTYIWFPDDHTHGTAPGAFTPESCVADNDLALGKLIDAITHNKRYWHDEPTAIFVVEDDAQGGLDHVEGHRTVGLVISPYNRRGQVFSANFNQLSMIRTIELMLNLPPLNQFDAAATPMRSIFQDRTDSRPYTLHTNQIALNLRNPPVRKLSGSARHWAIVSSRLDFSAPDRADPEKLTQILWHHTHGDETYPVQ